MIVPKLCWSGLGGSSIPTLPDFRTYLRHPINAPWHSLLLDTGEANAVQQTVDHIGPDIIFYLVWDLNDFERSIITGTRNLLAAQAALKKDCRFVFLSTDAVFDGENPPYAEQDVPEPIFPYGVAKKVAENQVLKGQGTVVRTSLVYGFNPPDPRTAELLRGLKSGDFRYTYFVDERRCPTFVLDLCRALTGIGQMQAKRPDIIHVTGPEALSRYDFVKKTGLCVRLRS